MKNLKFLSLLVLAMVFIGLTACDEDAVTFQEAVQLDEGPEMQAKASSNCFNIKVSAEPMDLGCACIVAPFDCTPEPTILCNFGAIPNATVTFGDYGGYMTSIVTGLEQSGNPPTGNGAMHITLIHYFVTMDGQHAFWTDDQAVCAPGSDPFSCIVNDKLDIVGGCGDFDGATGKLHTHGTLTFDGGAEPCPIFYLGGAEDLVPTGTLDIRWHGRICMP